MFVHFSVLLTMLATTVEVTVTTASYNQPHGLRISWLYECQSIAPMIGQDMARRNNQKNTGNKATFDLLQI